MILKQENLYFAFLGIYMKIEIIWNIKKKLEDYQKNIISQNGNEYSIENESNNGKREFYENRKLNKFEIFQLLFNSNKKKELI